MRYLYLDGSLVETQLVELRRGLQERPVLVDESYCCYAYRFASRSCPRGYLSRSENSRNIRQVSKSKISGRNFLIRIPCIIRIEKRKTTTPSLRNLVRVIRIPTNTDNAPPQTARSIRHISAGRGLALRGLDATRISMTKLMKFTTGIYANASGRRKK